MADALETVRAALIADATVAGLVGTRISPPPRPQDSGEPAVVLQVIGTEPEWHLRGQSDLDKVVLQIECHGTTYQQAKVLAAAVRAVLELRGDVMTSEIREHESVTETHQFTQDWDVWIVPG